MNTKKLFQPLLVIVLLILPLAASAHEGHVHDDDATPTPSATPSATATPEPLPGAANDQSSRLPVVAIAATTLIVIGGVVLYRARKR